MGSLPSVPDFRLPKLLSKEVVPNGTGTTFGLRAYNPEVFGNPPVAEVCAMEYRLWLSETIREAAAIITILFAGVLVTVAILHHWLPANNLYLFSWDLAHQVLFYIGGLLALVEWIMVKYLNTPIEKHVFTGVVLGLMFIASFQVWLDEHHNSEELIKEKSQLVGEMEFWKGQSYAKDESLRTRDALLSQNFGTLSGTQQSLSQLSNKILDISKPEHLAIHPIALMPAKDTTNSVAQYQKVFVLLVNKAIVPVHILVKCDKPIVSASGGILGTTMTLMNDTWPGARSDGSFGVGAGGGVWGPLSPLVVTIYFDEGDDRKCSFNEQ
ncbi:MAG: hypothetical protein WA213_10955 [Terriglobales bacterium]